MAEKEQDIQQEQQITLETGTYEIIRNRLLAKGKELNEKLDKLNGERKSVFGAIDNKLIATERITTEYACAPADMVSLGKLFLFGYNVHMGLKTKVQISDVFSIYEYNDHTFKEKNLSFISDNQFFADFEHLYRYYKKTVFEKFAMIGPNLFMVFKIGEGANDIKTFKWLVKGGTLTYLDNRSDHEYVYPDQHEFRWKRPTRDDYQDGKHPHISIEDRVFVETTEGDLTIKVENNTDTGQGIYSEDVLDPDQTLDDAEFFYAILGNLVIFKIRPYREENFRYIVYNSKIQAATRIDSIKDSCVLLPEDHGIIFSNGYYLQTGEYKLFDKASSNMHFEKQVPSPNGEDYLYVFFNKKEGIYILLSYNLIEQRVETPIICHGYTIFDNGELCYFKSNDEAVKHHVVQIWQTPYLHSDYEPPVKNDSYLFKIGNKDIVRAMAECHETLSLIRKEDTYGDLYIDLVKKTTDIIDSYYWLNKEEVFNLSESLAEIRSTADSAIDEYEKVTRIKRNTSERIKAVTGQVDELLGTLNRKKFDTIDVYVQALADLRRLSGDTISLKELRYTNPKIIEEYEHKLSEKISLYSEKCVKFLLREEALEPYQEKIKEFTGRVKKVKKLIEADELEKELLETSQGLEMLIEIVGNLKIEDATETTRIIDNISTIYASFNTIRASLRKKREELILIEGRAEFNAQIKLINQGVINYIDLADVPDKCDEYLGKIMIQLEELEGKFADFDEFMDQLTQKREEAYEAFESRKLALVEARNRRTNALYSSAERVLKAIQNRIAKFEEANEINAYYASDIMINKVRDIVDELIKLEDPVKADDIRSKLKSIREEAIRQLKDKKELFTEGENIIKFGNNHFSVNTQPLNSTMVLRGDDMFFHLSGTAFFEKVLNESFLQTKPVWQQEIISENKKVYRGEYLAWLVSSEFGFQALQNFNDDELNDALQAFISGRFSEGYIKGVHDLDALKLIKVLASIHQDADLLRYSPIERTCAKYYWQHIAGKESKNNILQRVRSASFIIKAFPNSEQFSEIISFISEQMNDAYNKNPLFCANITLSAEYLFYELEKDILRFVVSSDALQLMQLFLHFLKDKNQMRPFEESVISVRQFENEHFKTIRNWLKAFVKVNDSGDFSEWIDETADLLLNDDFKNRQEIQVKVNQDIEGFLGNHPHIDSNTYHLKLYDYNRKLEAHLTETVPAFQSYTKLKQKLVKDFEEEIRLNEFKPRVLSSFVRNRLIDKVYLPLIGNNLAKQIGTAGDNTRTDRMGMLLLISPPGYGKTTLMEYVANRLGLIFMKINGPALGHNIVSVDPEQANNSGAREELQKLNLAFEMGDNVMIYLDDIQHCNPEFLQKFISLADAQRKIEGIYKGKPRTYDFRGKKVCVVMAGNPYTESGEKFKIPDMLANRADIYNLGDIIGGTEDMFRLSYIENCLTSNSILQNLASKSQKDVYAMLQLAETGQKEGLEFETNHSVEEINEYVSVLKKLIKVRDIVYTVNQQYIYSAGQADEYRTEPAFKLQGSYRDMNKLAEKIVPVMNDEELDIIILSHYENESQTLTTGAEANLLKFKEMTGNLHGKDVPRWAKIKSVFQKNQKLKGYGQNNQIAPVLEEMEKMTKNLSGIERVLYEIIMDSER